jgi:hypothetical protein
MPIFKPFLLSLSFFGQLKEAEKGGKKGELKRGKEGAN